jgi:hypothetical protein
MRSLRASEIAQREEELLEVVIEWQILVRDRSRGFRSPVPRPIVHPGLRKVVALHVALTEHANRSRGAC